MNIEEAKQLKQKMDSDISDVIRDFIDKTGLSVDYVSLSFVDASTIGEERQLLQSVKTEVSLP
jgi:hypothetical protein